MNIYTGQPIIRDLFVRQSTMMDCRKRCRWSVEDITTFFEKFFIYKRNFKRIAEFLLQKTFKDVIDFFYLVKKHCKLSKLEKEIQECVGNKLHTIHSIVEKLVTEKFNLKSTLSFKCSENY